MAYKNEPFPHWLIAPNPTRIPRFSTDVAETYGGYEQTNQNWETPLNQYDITAQGSAAAMAALEAHFLAMRGRAHAFPFRDLCDFSVTLANIGTGNGTNRVFQLTKKYVSGGETFTRSIVKPESGTVSIYVNGVLKTTGFTLDYQTGILTFSVGQAPPNGHAVTWTGNFYVPARYDQDALDQNGIAGFRTGGVGGYAVNLKITEKRL